MNFIGLYIDRISIPHDMNVYYLILSKKTFYHIRNSKLYHDEHAVRYIMKYGKRIIY